MGSWRPALRQEVKVLIPVLIDAMERHGHLNLDGVIKAKLLKVSAVTRRWTSVGQLEPARFWGARRFPLKPIAQAFSL